MDSYMSRLLAVSYTHLTAVLSASFYEPVGQLQSPQTAVCLGMGEDAGERLSER